MSIVRILAVLMLTGCSSVPVVVEKPVIVEKAVTVTIPADLLARCGGKPPSLDATATNGDLLMSWHGQRSYIDCLESRLQRIREIQPRSTSASPQPPAPAR